MRKLIVHIGANKTGSSAIQSFLRENAAPLAKSGLLVAPSDLSPTGEVSGQHVWFFERLFENIPAGQRELVTRLDALPSEGQTRLLLSAENLSNGLGAQQLFAEASRSYEIRVILYIRRQDELLLSSWQQWESKIGSDFWAWLTECVGIRGDWKDVLVAWEGIVPFQNIAVQIYDRDRLVGGNVVADFVNTLGLSEVSGLSLSSTPVNPSFAEVVLEFAKGNPALFRDKHDNEFYNIVDQLTLGTYHRDPRESAITHQQRCAIVQRYSESNEWVRRRYFPQSEGPLFRMPEPGDYFVLSERKLSERRWDLVAAMLFGTAKRVLR